MKKEIHPKYETATVTCGPVPDCGTLKVKPLWLFTDDQTVMAGLQSKVPVTPPLSVTVQLDDSPERNQA